MHPDSLVSDLGPVVGVRRGRRWTVYACGCVGHGRTYPEALRDALIGRALA